TLHESHAEHPRSPPRLRPRGARRGQGVGCLARGRRDLPPLRRREGRGRRGDAALRAERRGPAPRARGVREHLRARGRARRRFGRLSGRLDGRESARDTPSRALSRGGYRPHSVGSARHPRLTRIAGVARALGLSLVPGLSVVAAGLALRRSLLTAFTPAAVVDYVASAAAGTVAWAALVVAAAHRASPTRWVARGALAALAVLAVGTQLEAWDRYGAYLNWRTALMGCSLWPCLAQELLADRARTFALLLAPAAVALGVAAWLQRAAPPGRLAGTAALPLGLLLVALAAALGKPDAGSDSGATPDVLWLNAVASPVTSKRAQEALPAGLGKPDAVWDSGATPDVLWLNAVASLVKSKRSHEDIMVELRWLPTGRPPDPLPALHASPARSRSVLLVLDESVRASDVCSVISHDGQDGHEGHGGPDGHACDESPFTNALLRGRFGFTAMRSVDSTTTLSLAALMTGLSPAEPRARLLSAPMLPEVAHAAG